VDTTHTTKKKKVLLVASTKIGSKGNADTPSKNDGLFGLSIKKEKKWSGEKV